MTDIHMVTFLFECDIPPILANTNIKCIIQSHYRAAEQALHVALAAGYYVDREHMAPAGCNLLVFCERSNLGVTEVTKFQKH